MGKSLKESLQSLDHWFQQKKRVLPWRDVPTVYRVWISEIMLQQTQVATVVPYFERFISRFPSVESLSSADEEEVMRYWAGLGYYSRARNLHRGAQVIVKKRRFPKTREEWLEIPGVGPYTAGAILSIALDRPEAILDGNVERVLSRIRRCTRQKGDAHFKERLWKLSRIFVEWGQRYQVRPSVLNQALMELGATLCTPKKPKCEKCPLGKICRAHQKSDMESFPPKKKPKKWIHLEETLHCVIHESGRILLKKRQLGQWRAGLWDLLEEMPLGYSKRSESLGKIQTRHVVTQHKIQRTTQVWKLTQKKESLLQSAEGESDLRWVSIEDPEVAVGSALKKVLKGLKELNS